jgi:predicted amidohydrolase YtcJ
MLRATPLQDAEKRILNGKWGMGNGKNLMILPFPICHFSSGRRFSVAWICAIVAATFAAVDHPHVAAARQAAPADLVVLNGNIVTVDRTGSVVKAVAIRDGKFVAVGGDADVRPLIGKATRVIDASGRTVIPGLIDSHVHATGVASAEAIQPFKNLESIAAIKDWMRERAAGLPAGTWIWSPRVFPTRVRERRFPTRAELDTAAPNHPVVIDAAYALMLNTKALEAAKITSRTPDPAGGAIVKDAKGEPTGLLRNVGAMLARFAPADQERVPLDLLERVHRAYNRVGITSVVERGANLAGYQAYDALKRENRLHVRSTVTIRIPNIPQCRDGAGDTATRPPCPEQLAEVERFIGSLPVKAGSGDDWLKVGPLKIVADGGILAGTSFMRKPYGIGSRQLYGVEDAGYRGFLTLTPQQIRAAFAAGHSQGWQVVAHVTGDAGVDAVLDAIEAAQAKDGKPSRRHTLIHAYFSNPETAQRAAQLGVPVDTQPAWYYKDADALSDALGRSRLEHFIGVRTWLENGARVALNTDHMFGLDPDSSLNPFNPFLTMYVATSRVTEGKQTVGAGEAVTREQALRMMTIDAAFLSFDEGNRGSIEVGKLGDLVVLSDHLLTCPVEQIRRIRPVVTVLGGKVIHE